MALFRKKEVIRWGIGKRAEPPFLWFGYLGGVQGRTPRFGEEGIVGIGVWKGGLCPPSFEPALPFGKEVSSLPP